MFPCSSIFGVIAFSTTGLPATYIDAPIISPAMEHFSINIPSSLLYWGRVLVRFSCSTTVSYQFKMVSSVVVVVGNSLVSFFV